MRVSPPVIKRMRVTNACTMWTSVRVIIGVKYHSIEMVEQQVLVESTLKKVRKSYSREDKLKVVKYYHENGKNLYQMCKRFSMKSKLVISLASHYDSIIFHHTDSVSVMTVAVFSLKSKLLSQYWMPNTLVDLMSSNNTLHNILFHGDQDRLTIFNTTW